MRFCFIFALLFASCLCVEWWEDATFYHIYPRSFADSNGDGVGDLRGIISKLDYLKEIGVTATWLSPIFKSSMVDYGYGISNFFEIDPIFGTMEDFIELVKKAKENDLKILLDFVPNHSSDEHEYFQKSVQKDPEYKDFYVWHPGKVVNGKHQPPTNWLNVHGESAWTYHEQRQEYYLHQFHAKQPDFNFRNQKVLDYFKEIFNFWMDKGVDGLHFRNCSPIFEKMNEDGSYPDEPRNDAVDDSHNYEYLDHIYTKDQPETVDLIYEWRKLVDTYAKKHGGKPRVIVVEAHSPIPYLNKLTGNEAHKGAHIVLNYHLMNLNAKSTASDVNTKVHDWMDSIFKDYHVANWVLGNDDYPRISDRFGANKVDHMNMFLVGLPGVTVTYYGEELGMHNVHIGSTGAYGEHDGERTPMQWDDSTSAGFSTNATTWLPIADDYKTFNVKYQRSHPKSHLNIYKALQLLTKTPEFRNFKDDKFFAYGAITQYVFYIKRTSANYGYLFLLNFGDKRENFHFDRNFFGSGVTEIEYFIVSEHSTHNIGEKINVSGFNLQPYEAVVMKWKVSRA